MFAARRWGRWPDLTFEAAGREPGDRPVSRLFARVGRGAPKQWERDPHAAIAVS
jgi:hypothetical protein